METSSRAMFGIFAAATTFCVLAVWHATVLAAAAPPKLAVEVPTPPAALVGEPAPSYYSEIDRLKVENANLRRMISLLEDKVRLLEEINKKANK